MYSMVWHFTYVFVDVNGTIGRSYTNPEAPGTGSNTSWCKLSAIKKNDQLH